MRRALSQGGGSIEEHPGLGMNPRTQQQQQQGLLYDTPHHVHPHFTRMVETQHGFSIVTSGGSTAAAITSQPPGMGAGPSLSGTAGKGLPHQSVEERLKELESTKAGKKEGKAPASEVYGFVAYLASMVAFGILPSFFSRLPLSLVP